MVRAFAFAVMIIAKGASAASSGDLFDLTCGDRYKGTTAADYVKIGCSCTEYGHANTATGTAACTGASDLDDCPTFCCKAPTKATCASVYAASFADGRWSTKMPVITANSSFTGCPSDKYIDITKFTATVVGTTNAAIALECCAAKPKCSTITCSSRRRSSSSFISGTIQNKASAAALTCGDTSECETKCCETITTTCAGAPSANTCTTADTTTDSSKAATKFTTYATDCCSAKMKCSAHTCGSVYKDKTTKATITCSGLECSNSECCDYKDTACMKEVIACGTGMSFTGHTKEFATGAAAAAKITACCTKTPAAVAYTCTDFWGAAVGSSNGLISGTVHQSVSLVVGIASIVLLSMAQ